MKLLSAIVTFFLLSVGVTYADQGLCRSDQYHVRAHFRRGYTRSDGAIVKPTNIKAHCKALTKGYEYSKGRFKSGTPSDWPHKNEKAVVWTDSEKERVIEVLDGLPDILLSDSVKGIYRLKKSKDFPNPASNANGIVVIYDNAFDSSRDLGRIIGHELSHQNFKDLNKDEKQDYRRATGWHLNLESDRRIYWEPRQEGFVEEDGKISFEEDYANNLEHYLYDPDRLKKVTPNAYNWIKKRFGDGFKLKRQK